MAGAGVRVFQAGEVLTATLVNTYLQDQVVARFASAAARDAAFGGAGEPTLEEGRVCYLDSTNSLQYYSGSAWVSINSEAVTGEVQAKGDLVVGTGLNTISRVAVGANDTILVADSTTSTGLAWKTQPVAAANSITSAQIVTGTIVDANISASAAISLSKLATGALPTAITVTSANISDLSIVNDDISGSASIAHTKLANATAGQVLLGTTTTGVVTATTVSGDVTITGAGVTTIGPTKVTNAMLAGSIVDTKLATISTTGKVSNSATTATDANTASAIVARDAAGKVAVTAIDVTTVIETASIVASASTGTINIDFSTNPTVYYTANATNDWTLNVRGTSGVTLNDTLTTGQIATVTFLATIGATQKRPTVFQVDGSAVTPKWMGGTAPTTGNASSIDAYTLAIIKTGSAAFTMLASQTRFA